ncbi:MAG: hypothetical protein ACTJHT_14780 [Sphingobacterium sp.]
MKRRVLSLFRSREQNPTTLSRFLCRRAVLYVLPNVVFNFVIAYASFAELGYTHFFAGSQSLARLIMPMAIFLPVILTMDIIKRVITAADKKLIEFTVDTELDQRKFITKMCMVHGISAGLLVLCILLFGQYCLSSTYKLGATAMSIVDGVLAGLFSLLFTYLPVRKLRRHLNKTAPDVVEIEHSR